MDEGGLVYVFTNVLDPCELFADKMTCSRTARS